MGFKEQFGHKTAQMRDGVKKGVKAAEDFVEAKFDKIEDKWSGWKLDYEEISKDQKFVDFMDKTGQKLDLSKDPWETREAYVVFQRFEKVSSKYQELFEKQLNSLVSGKEDIKADIHEGVLELFKTHPEELRKLEKNIDIVEESEKSIAMTQKELQKYESAGGRKGLEHKLDTLQKANSYGAMFARLMRSDHDPRILSRKKAKEEYGLLDSKSIGNEIQAVKADLRVVKNLEQAKEAIRNKYTTERNLIFFENSVALKLKEKTQAAMEKFIDGKAVPSTIEEIYRARNYNAVAKDRFYNESVRKVDSKVKETHIDYLDNTAETYEEAEEYFDKELDKVLLDRVTVLIKQTHPTAIEQQVKTYFRRSEFAGKTQRESAEIVMKIFEKVQKVMPDTDPKKKLLQDSLIHLEYIIM